MKQWANAHRDAFYEVLGSRYIMYGEWMYAKHSVFYDALPHYFLEFDVLDRQTGQFLDTPSRRSLLAGLPVVSVPVLACGSFSSREELLRLLGPSRFITKESRERLREEAVRLGLDPERQLRETVCALIRYHMAAPRLGENEDRVRLLQIAAQGELAEDFSLWRLCLLGRADMLGRTADDTEDLLERAALTELLAEEFGCLYGPKSFASPYAKRAYLKGRLKWADGELYDDTWGQVVLLCGLPGTGKDTWIRENCPGMPVVSLDEIRREMKVSPAESQGPVAVEARERARAYLRARQPFVWNATSLTPELRRKSVELFEAYQASVRIVFLETGWEEGLRRNRERGKEDPAKMVPECRIEAMLERMTPPERFEAQQVEWRIT